MADDTLIKMLVIMLAVNVVLGLADYAITDYRAGAAERYGFNTTTAAGFTNDGTISGGIGTTAADIGLDTADSIEESTGNIFTDAIKTFKAWVNKIDESLGLIGSILTQPAGFLNVMGFPAPISTAFGIIWFSMGMFLIISFIRG